MTSVTESMETVNTQLDSIRELFYRAFELGNGEPREKELIKRELLCAVNDLRLTASKL